MTTEINNGNRLPSCVCKHEGKFKFIRVCFNRLPNLPHFGYNVFKLAVSTDPSQGIYRGIESLSARSVTRYSLKSRS